MMMTQELRNDLAHNAARLEILEQKALADKADALLEEYAKAHLPGVYADNDTFYRVRWNQAKTHLYAVVIIPTANGIRFGQFAKGAMSRLTHADMLTADQCEALSLAWGNCVMCGKGLTVKASVTRGMGPVCAKGYGKP